MIYKKGKLKKASILIISAMLFMSVFFAQTSEAVGTPIPICIELNTFNVSNVGGDTASTLFWAKGSSKVSGDVLRVVSNSNNQHGTVVRRNKIRLNGGFSTYFVMNLNGSYGTPADGLTFIVQDNPTPMLGDYGSGLGYRGISNSFGVEFDIYNNPGTDGGYGVNDPNANHVAIVQNGSNDHKTSNASTVDSSPGFTLYGRDVHIWVDYDTTGLLTVYYGTSDDRSSAKKISKNVGTSLNNKDVYVGFAASTGGCNANHDIKKMYFKDSYVEGGLKTTTGTYTQGASVINITLQNSSGSTVTTNPSKANIIVKDASNNNMKNENASIYIDNVLVKTVNTGTTGTEAYYNFSGLSAGSHTIKAVASSGGATNSTTFSVTDSTKPTTPTLAFSGYTANTWTNNNVSFKIDGSTDSGTGVSNYQYSINGGTSWTTGSTGTINLEGTYTVLGRAVDGAGNISDSSVGQIVKIDKTKPTAPTLTFSGYTANTWTNKDVSFNLSGSTDSKAGVSNYQYSINGGTSWTTGSTGTINLEGTYTVLGRAVDNVGNISDSSVVQIVKIDKTKSTAPILTFSGYTANTWTNKDVSFNISGSTDSKSGVSNYQYSINGGTSWTTGVTGTISEDGTYTVIGRAVDGAGNISDSSVGQIVKIDKTKPTAPTLTFSGYTANTWTNKDVSFNISGSTDSKSGVSNYQYSINGGTSWTTGSTYTISAEGTYTVIGRALDNVGNISDSSVGQIVKIDKTKPTISSFKINDDDIYTNSQSVTLNVNSNDLGGSGVKTLKISNSSDFTVNTNVPYSASFSGFSLSEGSAEKTVYLKVLDAAGNESIVSTDSIMFDNISPSISLSVPNTYSATKGTTIEYVATYDDNNGIKNITLNASDVVLSAIGTADVSKLSASVEDMSNPNQKKISITVGNDMVGEGTIGLTLKPSTAVDNAGNLAQTITGTYSFVIDLTPPNNQEEIFKDNLTVKGGIAVTLDKTSKEAGGLASDSVRFAPVDYVESTPSNGETVTSTHGESKYINAPLKEGKYYLYVVDAAGNMSSKSSHVLTVKNSGPSIAITGPSNTLVKADSSVSYVVTYSGAANITLEQSDVALITTGTANAYVSVSNLNSSQKTVILSNIMGEGTIGIKIAAGTAVDEINNPSTASSLSEIVTVDNTAAIVSPVTLISSNTDKDYAKKGDTLTLNFTTNEVIQSVNVTILGQTITAANPSGDNKNWEAEYVIPIDDSMNSLDGTKATFSIETTDLAGNISSAVNTSTTGNDITLDFAKPVVDLDGTKIDGIYVSDVTVTFNDGTAVLTKVGTGDIDSNLVNGTVITEQGIYSLTVTDKAGNSTTKTFKFSKDYYKLVDDLDELEVIYADGDSDESVTRNVTLIKKGANGSTITWKSSDSDVISNTGVVTRQSDGPYSVVITATAINGEFNDTKAFTLVVKKLPDSGSPSGKAQEDVEAAYIIYSGKDDINNVTKSIELSATGLYWGHDIKWSSSDSCIQISDVVTSSSIQGTVVSGSGIKAADVYKAEVVRPQFVDGDKIVTLTAKVSYDTGVQERPFKLIVKRLPGTEIEKVLEDAAKVTLKYAVGDNKDNVTQDITFVDETINGSSVTWQISNKSYVKDSGHVIRPAIGQGDKTVKITATITNGSESIKKTYDITILENNKNSQISADLINDFNALEIGYAAGDSADSVSSNIFLTTKGSSGSSVVWSSNHVEVISNNGYVHRTDSDISVTLTATISKVGQSITKTFVLNVKELNGTLLEQLQSDTDSLKIIYADGDNKDNVTKNLTFPITGANGSSITWSSNISSIIDTNGKVTRPAEDTTVIVTARLSKDSFFKEKTFTLLVKGATVVNLEADKAELDIVYSGDDSADKVTKTLYLTKTGETGSVISWTSSQPDLIEPSGRINRPGPNGSDRYVVITATITDTNTNETTTKSFTVLVKKLSNSEAVQAAVKNLTVDKAFDLAVGDKWESITSSFLMLTNGDYETSIEWTSDKTNVIEIGNVKEGSTLKNTIINRQDKDTEVILTAKVTRNDFSLTKTFLLVVKSEAVTKQEDVTRIATGRTASGTAGNGSEEYQILRTTLSNGETVDTVILDETTMQNLTDGINPTDSNENNRTVTVQLEQNQEDFANEEAVEMSAASVAAVADRNAGLVIVSHGVQVDIDSDTMSDISDRGIDLYFRIRQLNSASEVESIKDAVTSSFIIKEAAGNNNVAVQGIPLAVETNYSNFSTDLVIPFTGIDIPTIDTEAFLSSLRVYVQHSDGTTEVLSGSIVYKNGKPYGIKINIDKFSSFQIVRFYAESSHRSKTSTTVVNDENENLVKLPVEDLVESENKNKNSTIELNDTITVIKPSSISTDELLKLLDTTVSKDIDLCVEVSKTDEKETQKIKDKIEKIKGNLIGVPTTLNISATDGTKTVNLNEFNDYITFNIPLEEGQDLSKITTAVRINENGSITHVPTKVTVIDNKYYAQVNCIEGGIFAIIWHPIEFADMVGKWSAPDVNDMGSRTVLEGKSSEQFDPDTKITRAEFTAIVVRSLGLRKTTDIDFSDIKSSDWYYNSVRTASLYGIIKGYDDGTFRANQKISREEAMAMISRAMKISGLDTDIKASEVENLLTIFTDSEQTATWAKGNIAACLKEGIVFGKNEKNLAPKDEITRAEVAVIISRMLKKANLI